MLSPRWTDRAFNDRAADLFRTPAFAIVWVAYLLGCVADCVTTQIALGAGLRERNPLAEDVYALGGVAGLWALKAGVVGLLLAGLTFVPRRIAVPFAGALAITMAAAVNANLAALRTIGF